MSVSGKLQPALLVFLTALTIPVIILNIGGAVISGIWLAILGEWKPILQGIGFMIVAWFALGFALMPSLIFVAPAMKLIEKGKIGLGMFVGSFSLLYTNALITVWCIWILTLFLEQADQKSFIPMLIWSYGVALAPWIGMAEKEREVNEYSTFTAFTAAIAYIITMIMVVFGAAFVTIFVTFGLIMFISAILQTFVAFAMERQQGYPTFHYGQESFEEEERIHAEEKSYLPEGDSAQKYCSACGTKIKKGASFCSQCGKAIGI